MIFFMLLAYILLALLVGSWVYCGVTVLAAWRYQQVRPAEAGSLPPMSILKPLAGADEGLPENLASFFEQEYPEFEILFAVREPSDPAVPVVEKLRAQFPGIPSQLII